MTTEGEESGHLLSVGADDTGLSTDFANIIIDVSLFKKYQGIARKTALLHLV